MKMARQLAAYASVGAVATLAHYAVLIALVEAAGWRAVPATLCGYVVGGGDRDSVCACRLGAPTRKTLSASIQSRSCEPHGLTKD